MGLIDVLNGQLDRIDIPKVETTSQVEISKSTRNWLTAIVILIAILILRK